MTDLGPEELKKRKQRNVAIALAIVAFIVIVYIVTMLKLASPA